VLATALLAVPFLTMQPTESASQEPTGEVFEARDRIEERFASSVFATFTVIEDREGDILRVEPLQELLANTEALRSDPEIGPTLFGFYDVDADLEVDGLLTIAELIDRRLPSGLSAATDAEVKAVAADLIVERGTVDLGLASQATTGPDGATSPALLLPVLSDDTVLGFGGTGVRLGTDTAPEEYSRDVLALLQGEQITFEVWGVANDVNLTSAEEGEAAGPFIGFTIAAVLIIVGLTFRSYWALAVTGAALSSLIIWLGGIANLLGLKEDLILSLIVPIAMISFGVDFAFHAVGRYREQAAIGLRPRAAFATGLAAVSSALILALVTGSAAFLSNSTAGIESIIQFGIGAAIALAAAFILLGVVTPLALMVIEEKVGRPAPTRRRQLGAVFGSALAAMAAMASVLFSVFILPPVGLVILGVYVIAAIVVPYLVARPGAIETAATSEPGRGAEAVGATVSGLARHPLLVLSSAAVITAGAAVFAVRVPTEFDVKDFFSAESGFVIGLDKIDEFGGEQAGEPADILIETDLTDVAAVARIQQFVAEFEALDSERFARNDAGELNLEGGLLEVVEEVWRHPAALGAIAGSTGVALTDVDGDGLPDTTEQMGALIAATRSIGVPVNEQQVSFTADQVRSGLWVADSEAGVQLDGNGPAGADLLQGSAATTATRISIGLPGSREVSNIVDAREELAPLIESLETDLQAFDVDSSVVVTGGPIARQESLDAISRALQISLPIAVVICLLIAAAFMRSLRLAVIVIIPILLVVAWLYAVMYLFGFAINLVTATIGAVSIGIGVDFAIHFTERFREELAEHGDTHTAIRATAEGTGTALVASALSSMVGFAILALAPMPLFASYGLLTAIMIAMALVASLAVLPSILAVAHRSPDRSAGRSDERVGSAVGDGPAESVPGFSSNSSTAGGGRTPASVG
jgi:predicted RND superfamily exporter protein